MKILFLWTGLTSYMADCWRELQRREGIELKVVVINVVSGSAFDRSKTLYDLDAQVVDKDYDGPLDLGGFRPDIVFSVGWHAPAVRRVVLDPDWRSIPKICCFDMPWRNSLRCVLARFVLRRFLSHYAAAYVPGKFAAKYARWLGFPRIETGLFSIDLNRLSGGKPVAPELLRYGCPAWADRTLELAKGLL